MLARRTWSILGVRARCRAAPEAILGSLRTLLRGFPAASEPALDRLDFDVRADEAGTHWVLLDPQGAATRTIRLRSPPGGAAEHLTIREALDRVEDRLFLHSAALAGPAGTVLAVGPSASGKTSLALRLWSEGLHLLGDDLCPIRYGGTRPEPFPRALHLDQRYPADLLARIPPVPRGYPTGYYPFPQPGPAALDPVRTILVLERGGPAAGELVPLGPSEAAHRLLSAAIRTRGFRFGRAMRTVVRLAATADRSFTLRATTAEGAARNALRAIG